VNNEMYNIFKSITHHQTLKLSHGCVSGVVDRVIPTNLTLTGQIECPRCNYKFSSVDLFSFVVH